MWDSPTMWYTVSITDDRISILINHRSNGLLFWIPSVIFRYLKLLHVCCEISDDYAGQLSPSSLNTIECINIFQCSQTRMELCSSIIRFLLDSMPENYLTTIYWAVIARSKCDSTEQIWFPVPSKEIPSNHFNAALVVLKQSGRETPQ